MLSSGHCPSAVYADAQPTAICAGLNRAEYRWWHLAVEATVPPASLVLLEGADVVAEESRVLRSRVRDQGLRLGQLQPELLVQELADPSLDRLRLLPWPDEPQQEVVGIA